jgi:hypothetical protein
MCKREVYAYYRADKPELDFPWHVRADGNELDAVLTPRKFSVKTLTHHYRNPSRTRAAATTAALEPQALWKLAEDFAFEVTYCSAVVAT